MRQHNTAGCFPFWYIRFPFPEPHVNVTWAGWRAGERRRRGRRRRRRCCRFHRSQMIRSRWQRIVVCRIKASPLRPGFQCAPLRGAPAPSPSRIPEKTQRRSGEEKGKVGLVAGVEFLCETLFPPLCQVIPLCRWCGKETKAPSAGGSVRPDPRGRWRWKGEKFGSAAPHQHRINFLWPVLCSSSVTSSKLPFLSASPIRNPSHTHTHKP